MSKENVEVVHAIEKAWDENKLDDLDQYFAADFLSHSVPPGMPGTLDTFKMLHQMSMGAMPDRKVEILDTIDGGDKIAVRCIMTGTNNGTGFPWFGVEANGAKVAVEWVSIYRVEGGKVAEQWGVIDGFTMLPQLGAWTPPPMPG